MGGKQRARVADGIRQSSTTIMHGAPSPQSMANNQSTIYSRYARAGRRLTGSAGPAMLGTSQRQGSRSSASLRPSPSISLSLSRQNIEPLSRGKMRQERAKAGLHAGQTTCVRKACRCPPSSHSLRHMFLAFPLSLPLALFAASLTQPGRGAEIGRLERRVLGGS